jgi:hypothetical protein
MFLWYPVLDLARATLRTERKKSSGYENDSDTHNGRTPLAADHLTFEGGGGGFTGGSELFFWDGYVQVFFFYPITMYDFFSTLFRSIFFLNSLYYLDSLIIVNVEFSSFMHCF